MSVKKGKNKNRIKLISSTQTLLSNKTNQSVFGIFLIFIAVFIFAAFSSYLMNWSLDQSELEEGFLSLLANDDYKVHNVLGKIGAALGHNFIYHGFGVSAFLLPFFIFLLGLKFSLRAQQKSLYKKLLNYVYFLIWTPSMFAFLVPNNALIAGSNGIGTNVFLVNLLGQLGLGISLFFAIIIYCAIYFKWTAEKISHFIGKMVLKFKTKDTELVTEHEFSSATTEEIESETSDLNIKIESKTELANESKELELDAVHQTKEKSVVIESRSDGIQLESITEPIVEAEADIKLEDEEDSADLEIETAAKEELVSNKEINKTLKDFGEYDPKLDLSRFKLPNIDLLTDYGESNITINQEELEENKNKIVNTLNNYNIEISKIKATIGPTVTLYEIVPAAGVRISKIKNLEDDIALSLSALGIRIIAPIPGKGTIGIEVPSTSPQMVPMRNLIKSEKFQKTDMELPIAFGKTISNETFIADLAKMPHMLMAGATGQGKSVGLNVILTSILYKKHPSQVKFILVDPKKVELTLFNKIERHYLAKLPDTEEAIITDTSKVVATLNSLCIEMDNRYDLLKTAFCRNLKEYNAKFVQRKLNPEDGHKYLPYIILVIDEFADLIMTAGKEVETPIARLAQLARAIGIHLIVATQRPSVNVITGIIKANFPTRAAFRVTSKIDSRTILDAGGAEQLIGKGDMLYSSGSEILRLQCAFVDTPEVELITDYIGSQQAYPEAYLLPEYKTDEEGGGLELNDISERDALFEDAARIIVIHQQGSASLLQRKLKLGYNRAGRIVDQLELAGIIGPFEGSKARQVLIPDEMSLEQLLKNEMDNL